MYILLFIGILFLINNGRILIKYYICVVDCFMFYFLSMLVIFDGLLFFFIFENFNFIILLFKYLRLKKFFEMYIFMIFVFIL